MEGRREENKTENKEENKTYEGWSVTFFSQPKAKKEGDGHIAAVLAAIRKENIQDYIDGYNLDYFPHLPALAYEVGGKDAVDLLAVLKAIGVENDMIKLNLKDNEMIIPQSVLSKIDQATLEERLSNISRDRMFEMTLKDDDIIIHTARFRKSHLKI